MKIYQITETNVEYTKGYKNDALIFIGNEKAVLDFVNERNEDEIYQDIEVALRWLEDNGYEYEIRKDLIERLEKGEIIYIQ